MAVSFPDEFKNAVAGGGALATSDFSSDTFKIQLHRTSAYTFSAAHDRESDFPAEVAEATLALAGVVGTLGAGIVNFDDTVFTSVAAGAAIDCAVIFNDTAVNKPFVCYISGFSVTPNGDNITFVWPAGGVLDFG